MFETRLTIILTTRRYLVDWAISRLVEQGMPFLLIGHLHLESKSDQRTKRSCSYALPSKSAFGPEADLNDLFSLHVALNLCVWPVTHFCGRLVATGFFPRVEINNEVQP